MKRVIFMLTDGSKAWEVKDFLVQQDNCEEVTIEGKNYPGKGANQVNKRNTPVTTNHISINSNMESPCY
jgi:hypothetical protein